MPLLLAQSKMALMTKANSSLKYNKCGSKTATKSRGPSGAGRGARPEARTEQAPLPSGGLWTRQREVAGTHTWGFLHSQERLK